MFYKTNLKLLMMLRKPGQIFGVDNSIFLLLSIVAFVFIFPIIDNMVLHDIFVTLSYTLVLISVFSIIEHKTRWMKYVVIVAIIANSVLLFDVNKYLMVSTLIVSAITFTIAAGILISHIAANKNVSLGVVIQAISGYLLIGIIGVLLNTILLSFNNSAITISQDVDRFSSVIYYSFITLTTIGYGEIVPKTIATQSVSIFIGAAGQIYLTVIIAMIVGKYLSVKES